MPLMYGQMRALAGSMLRNESGSHTLSATAMVNELYLRLADGPAPVNDRAHFAALAATVLRHILLDWARGKKRDKRGGGAIHETLKENSAALEADAETILEINRLLDRLNEVDERKVKVVEMVFFGGMTYDETAEVLGISAVTVHRELRMAKAWMRSELERAPEAVPAP
ncbi:sigma-70 family RNA polymerase sigma factor [Terriglobus aquaticus]